MKIKVINGPNINMLGIREKEIYGSKFYEDLINYIEGARTALSVEIDYFQSNHEGEIIDEIQSCYGKYEGIIINPAAYTHTSIGILDAVKAVGIPTVEVHLTNPEEREEFRKVSYVGLGCIKTISGKGFDGYVEAIKVLIENH